MEAGVLFTHLYSEHHRSGQFSHLASQATLLQLLVTVARARNADPLGASPRNVSRPIQTALNWMMARLGEPFAIQEVAAAVQMHPARFHERFLAEVGQTPAEWRIRQRIAEAKPVLTDTTHSITAIALSLGFATPQSFATAFKRYTGRTPTEYRVNQHPPENT
jgi:transcriptional regulator GlxA family with amidase domain